MTDMNLLALIAAAFIPMITGFIWYNPKFLGTIWMRECGLNEEKLKNANMIVIFVVSLFLSFLIGFFLQMVTIHQYGAMGMMGGDVAKAKPSYAAFMNDYGMAFRSFGHGALHSAIAAVFFVFPIIAINAMFERKSWKYIFLNAGYWLITLVLMGGLICGWYAPGGFNLVTPK